MKALKALNTIALAIPISIAALGVFDENFLLIALVLTMVTGFMQVVIGLLFWLEYRNNHYIQLYFFVVAAFFVMLLLEATNDWLWCIPPILCVYLSILIYTKK